MVLKTMTMTMMMIIMVMMMLMMMMMMMMLAMIIVLLAVVAPLGSSYAWAGLSCDDVTCTALGLGRRFLVLS